MMITLYGSKPMFGLPDPSPFVSKAEILLKMSGVPYVKAEASFSKSPKGKIPYIEDGGRRLGDSTFIRLHLEDKYGADFNKGLSAAERAVAWAFEKMAEEHLYWAIVHDRWMNAENFDSGPRAFFNAAPAPIRPFVIAMIKRTVKRNLHGHGMGRHTTVEIETLARRDVEAIATQLGGKPWLMGAEPGAADASVWSMVAGALSRHFRSNIRTDAEQRANLVAYRDRGMARWFPELAQST